MSRIDLNSKSWALGKVAGCLLVMLWGVWGCGVPAKQVSAVRESVRSNLLWPRPPSRARIRFIQVVRQPSDLGIHTSFWGRTVEFIFGEEEKWFIRPSDVAVLGKTIFVADPGAQSLWILDGGTKRFKRIQEVKKEKLVSPVALTLGGKDRVYLADSYLRKVFAFSHQGKLKGAIDYSLIQRPAGLAYDQVRDRLYVSDSLAHRIWLFTGEGKFIRSIGKRGAGKGEFNFPTYLSVDRKGILYVTDSLGFRMQYFSPEGAFMGVFGRHGDSSGNFAMPKGLAIDSEGHIYIVEALFDAVQIFDRQGRYLLTFGDRGVAPGQFWLPGGIFIDPEDRIYVADSYNQRIQVFEYIAEKKK